MDEFDEKAWLEQLSKAHSPEEIHQLVEELGRGAFDTLQTGLLEITKDLLEALPEDVRPLALAKQFPRIINRVALTWPYPAECEEYLNSLVVDNRGGRQGFSFAIFAEISALRSFYHDKHASIFLNDVWAKAHKR